MKQAGLQHLRNPLKWNTDALIAFETIKKELQQAPTLGIADYSKNFHLYVANRVDVMHQLYWCKRLVVGGKNSLLQHKVG